MSKLNRFTFKVALFVVPQVILATGLAAYFALNNYALLPYEQLFRYQVEKIALSEDYDTVFIGDSSLGNSIDAQYFSEQTGLKAMNLALVGSYGYAGTYNMLKRFYEKNPGLKNVYVIHTLDISRRELSHQGYLYSMSNLTDLTELNYREQSRVIYSAYNITAQVREYVKCLLRDNKNHIDNDYMVQKEKVDDPSEVVKFSVNEIAKDKYKYLKKIAEFAEEKKLNILYLHGPCYEKIVKRSQKYIDAVNKNIRETGLKVVTQTIAMPNEDLGDADDHVAPDKKVAYTQKYIDLIQANGGWR